MKRFFQSLSSWLWVSPSDKKERCRWKLNIISRIILCISCTYLVIYLNQYIILYWSLLPKVIILSPWHLTEKRFQKMTFWWNTYVVDTSPIRRGEGFNPSGSHSLSSPVYMVDKWKWSDCILIGLPALLVLFSSCWYY